MRRPARRVRRCPCDSTSRRGCSSTQRGRDSCAWCRGLCGHLAYAVRRVPCREVAVVALTSFVDADRAGARRRDAASCKLKRTRDLCARLRPAARAARGASGPQDLRAFSWRFVSLARTIRQDLSTSTSSKCRGSQAAPAGPPAQTTSQPSTHADDYHDDGHDDAPLPPPVARPPDSRPRAHHNTDNREVSDTGALASPSKLATRPSLTARRRRARQTE